jgi:sugar O-acyltransferase (sialic acid O-acetyltransferase NeuD family)
MMELAIIGAGGFGRETKRWAVDCEVSGLFPYTFYVDDEYAKGDIRPLSQLDGQRSLAVIAIGSPSDRQRIANRVRSDVQYTKLIHKTAICDKNSVGVGCIICPYVVITVNCKIGRHFHANLHSDVGHDCVVGHYVTLAPGARVSGNCNIGDGVYIGSNAVIREGVTIAPWTIIGANSVVLHDITESGTYVGVPAKKIK